MECSRDCRLGLGELGILKRKGSEAGSEVGEVVMTGLALNSQMITKLFFQCWGSNPRPHAC
jgi:hypothetical protein